MPIQASRRSFLATTLAASAGFAMGPAAFARAWKRDGDGLILAWDELSPGVHAMIDANTGGNVAVVVSGNEALVIDSKFPFFGQALRADAETLCGGTVSLINTHHHGDHTGGNAAFLGRGSDPVQGMAHGNAVSRILKQRDTYVRSAAGGPGQINGFAPDNQRLNDMAREMAGGAEQLRAGDWKPTLRLGDEGTITIGQTDVAYAHHGAGHTDNDLAMNIDGGRVVHTGDLVFNGLHPFFDQTAGVTAKGWVNSLDGVLAVCDADTVVIPGHGPVGDRETVAAQKRYLEQIIEAVQGEIDAGSSKEDTQEKSWDFMEGLGFEGIRPRAIGAVYDELNG